MRVHKLWALVGTTIAALALLSTRASAASPVEGTWLGSLSTGAMSIRVVINIQTAADASLTATMDSPDQGAFGISVDSVSFVDGTLTVEVKRISGLFTGQLQSTEKKIVGTWSQMGRSLPLTLVPGERVVAKRPQEPVKPYPYDEEEVRYDNTIAKVSLAGTLTKPRTAGPHPVVLLITGSGPQNRNEELMGHKPFLVLADYLTRRGIAVLRVDDRGVGTSTGTFATATTQDFVQDALAGVAYLKGRKDIDSKQIGLVGHSEGGLIAPAAAVKSTDVAFIVMLAGPGVRGEEILLRQMDQMAANNGASGAMRKWSANFNARILSIAAHAENSATAMTEMQSVLDEQLQVVNESTTLSASDKSRLQALANKDLARAQFQSLLTPWTRYFLVYDPLPVLRQVKCPVLAVNGALDQQVFVDQNLSFIEAALKNGGNKNFIVKELPGLNHLFQTAKTGAASEYGNIEETFAPTALAVVGDWVIKQTKSR